MHVDNPIVEPLGPVEHLHQITRMGAKELLEDVTQAATGHVSEQDAIARLSRTSRVLRLAEPTAGFC